MPEYEPADPHGSDAATVPGQHHLGPTVERFDEQVDAALERVRGNPVADRVFTTASHVGDFSLIWHAINLALAARRRSPRQALVFAALIGVESVVVNQGVKRLFRRARPTSTGDEGLRVRQPTTSSFPSGHASAATFAASLLAPRAGGVGGGFIGMIATVVATSRAYVRIHHASDVVAGFFTGAILVAVTRFVARRTGFDRFL